MKILYRSNSRQKWEPLKDKSYSDESHLQDLVYEDPTTIPVEDIDSDAELAPIEVIVKELALGIGSSDIVGIDAKGNIYIIEAKLAKNPEAKRAVIGQIMEYAANLWGRDLGWLEDRVKEKRKKGISEFFEKREDWDREAFEGNLKNSLLKGKFKLLVVVDRVNEELKRIITYVNQVLGVELYALELTYFKDEKGAEILVPSIHGGIRKPPSHPRVWDEDSFFEDVKTRITDPGTLQTMREIYDFSKQNGKVVFGKGAIYGTFRFRIPYRSKDVDLFSIQSDGESNSVNFRNLTDAGVDSVTVTEYLMQLKSLGFPFDEKEDLKRYPTFKLDILNDESRLSAFKKYAIDIKKRFS